MTDEKELTDRRVDHTKTIIVTVSLVLVCGGIVGSGWMVLQSIREQLAIPGNITATLSAPIALMAEATATVEPTATGTPWPTADMRYLSPHQTEAAIALQLADAHQKEIDAFATQQALNLQAGQATETKQSSEQATVQAAQTSRAIIGMTETPAARSFMAQMATATQQQAVTDRADMVAGGWQIVGMVAVSALILAVIYVVAVTVAYRVNGGGVEPEPVTEAGDGDELQTAALIRNETDDPHVYSVSRVPDPPGDSVKVLEWAKKALAGESVAVDPWEKSGPLTEYREYRKGVYAWLANNKLIVWKNKQILNERGIEVVTRYVEKHRPTQAIRPETPSTPSVSGKNGTDSSGGAEGVAWTPYNSTKGNGKNESKI